MSQTNIYSYNRINDNPQMQKTLTLNDLMEYEESRIMNETILKRPASGCPSGTYDSLHTCFCEDHCSWETCRLLKPPHNCLSVIDDLMQWGWDSIKGAWVAVDVRYLPKEYVIISEGKHYKTIFFSTCKDNKINWMLDSSISIYSALILSQIRALMVL